MPSLLTNLKIWHNFNSLPFEDSVGSSDFTNTGFTAASGVLGNAAASDGSSNNLYCAHNSDQEQTNKLSISFFLYLNAHGSGHYIIQKDQAFGGIYQQKWRVTTDSTGILRFAIYDSGYAIAITNGAIATGAWHHIVIVYDGTQTGNANRVKIYINSALDSSTFTGTFPATIPTTTPPLEIGGSQSSSSQLTFDGSIDLLGIWSDALDQTNVDDLYDGGAGFDPNDDDPHTRFWVASTDSNYSASSAWALTSGGTPGASAPNAGDTITFDGNGLGSCFVDRDISCDSFTVEAGYTGLISFGSYDLTCAGNISIEQNCQITGMGGSTWTCVDFTLNTEAGSTRDLNLGSTWEIDSSGDGFIYFSNVKNVTASNIFITALGSTDLGDNVNVIFSGGDSLALGGLDFTVSASIVVALSVFAPIVQPTGETNSASFLNYKDQTKFKLTVAGTPIDFNDAHFRMEDFSFNYDGKEVRFTEVATKGGFSYQTFDNEDAVTMQMDLGNGLETFFTGKIRKTEHSGVNNQESINYIAVGKQNLASEVDLIGPQGLPGDGIPGAIISVASVLSRILVSNASQLSSLGIPSTIGNPSNTTFSTNMNGDFNLSGGISVVEGLKRVASHEPAKRVFWDDLTQTWVFPDLTTPNISVFNITQANFEDVKYTIDTANRYTAIQICAALNNSLGIVFDELKVLPLSPGWEADNEADWTIENAMNAQVQAIFGNAYKNVFRLWTFDPQDNVPYMEDFPPRVYVLTQWWSKLMWCPIDAIIDWKRGYVGTKVPIIRKGNPHITGDAKGPLAAALCYVDPTLANVSLTGAACLRYPASGFEGTAYNQFAIEQTRHLKVDQQNLTNEYAQNKLAPLKDVVVTAQLPLWGDPIRQLINLQTQLTIIDSTRRTGLEGITAYVTEYAYSFGVPGKSTVTVTTDKALVTKSD